jgi:hypothetical protein
MKMTTEQWIERLAALDADAETDRAPARLRSKIYSALVNRLAGDGPLLSLSACEHAGGQLCIFEKGLTALPVGEQIESKNPCRVCHARVLAERLDRAPIFWPGCPYADFHKG